MQHSLPEIWLWNEIRLGNDRALHRLYMDQYDHLFRYGLHVTSDRALAKACVNGTFVEVWTKRKKLPEVDNVRGYLFIIYKRQLFHEIKLKTSRRNIKEVQPEAVDYELSYEALLIASQEEEETKSRLEKAIRKLTPRQKEFIRMRYFENLSIKEMSKKISISPRTIYNTLYAAIKALRADFIKKNKKK